MRNKLYALFMAFVLSLFSLPGFAPGRGDLVSYVSSRATSLEDSADLDHLISLAADRKLVLLGEASHGTHEFYAWRDSISRRLIAEKGFDFIVVEGDWASLYALNRYVKNMPGAHSTAREALEDLQRWPLWMWANEEVVALAEWLRQHNDELPPEDRVGFYGMDVYGEWHSMGEVLAFLQAHDEAVYEMAAGYYACFDNFGEDSWLYARLAARGEVNCASEVESVVGLFRENMGKLEQLPEYQMFYGKQNALVVKHAERFYRKAVVHPDASSWNSRVHYMSLTVDRLLGLYGLESKGIVWAHNTHIGDARFSEMGSHGQDNIGQLSRLDYGPESVFLIGFSTYTGRVKAGSEWGGRRQRMQVPRARPGSIEAIFEQTGLERFQLVFDDDDRTHEAFNRPYGNRAIGVVYDPGGDHLRNYVQSIVPMRYDALLFFRESRALTPLHRR